MFFQLKQLSASHMPGAVLGSEGLAVNETDKVPRYGTCILEGFHTQHGVRGKATWFDWHVFKQLLHG